MGEALHRLLLLRHAKSSHKDPDLVDFERPLNKRGRQDCRRIGKWLKSEDMVPDLVISSPAVRAKETALRVCKRMGYAEGKIQWEDSVYDANVRTLLKLLLEVPEETRTVMLVGHHEGLETMILRMSRWADIPAEPKLIPTCAVAHLDINGQWSEVKKCDARLRSIMRPRELAARESRPAA